MHPLAILTLTLSILVSEQTSEQPPCAQTNTCFVQCATFESLLDAFSCSSTMSNLCDNLQRQYEHFGCGQTVTCASTPGVTCSPSPCTITVENTALSPSCGGGGFCCTDGSCSEAFVVECIPVANTCMELPHLTFCPDGQKCCVYQSLNATANTSP